MPRAARRAGIARNVCAAAGVLLTLVVPPLHALELRVLSAGAVEPGMRPALAAFERDSGHTVRIEFAAARSPGRARRSAASASASPCARR